MRKSIDIVEDEPAIRDNYTAAFQRSGYSVRAYADREGAMTAFKTRLPDLAVIDVVEIVPHRLRTRETECRRRSG